MKGLEYAKLIYQGSKHGWKVSDFHKNCDGKGPTLTVLKSSAGQVFGGFTSVPWQTNEVGKYEAD